LLGFLIVRVIGIGDAVAVRIGVLSVVRVVRERVVGI
jgi:hypothetical protein